MVEHEGGRVFDVPATKGIYIPKAKGDSLTFIGPKSEQKQSVSRDLAA